MALKHLRETFVSSWNMENNQNHILLINTRKYTTEKNTHPSTFCSLFNQLPTYRMTNKYNPFVCWYKILDESHFVVNLVHQTVSI